MPKIRITEKDLTSSSTLTALDTVIYIPGPTADSQVVEPTLCSSVSDLEKLAENQVGRGRISSSSLSYRLANYILTTFKNAFVLYEGVGSDITADAKVPDKSWTTLEDLNNYDITFLTTGQYGYVADGAASCAKKRGDCVYLANTARSVPSSGIKEYKTLKGFVSPDKPEDWQEPSSSTAQEEWVQSLTAPKYFDNEARKDYIQIVGTATDRPKYEPNMFYQAVITSAGIEEYNLITTNSAPSDWGTASKKYYRANPFAHNPLVYKVAYTNDKYLEYYTPDHTTVENTRAAFTEKISEANGEFVACFAPWFITKIEALLPKDASGEATAESEDIPAAFGMLFAYLTSIQDNDPWISAAGAQNGTISQVTQFVTNFSNSDCEILQARAADKEVDLDALTDNVGMAINPLATIRPFGNIVWGYRTARINDKLEGLKASSFLNIRILLNILRKYLREFAQKYTFQQNDANLWTNFSNDVIEVLDMMKTGNGILDYRIEQVETSAKARLKAKITLVPIEPVEDFDLEIDLTDSITVSE